MTANRVKSVTQGQAKKDLAVPVQAGEARTATSPRTAPNVIYVYSDEMADVSLAHPDPAQVQATTQALLAMDERPDGGGRICSSSSR